jgi:hypothetical protein
MARAKAGNTFSNQFTILPKVFENSKQETLQGKQMSVDLISVKSNFARNKTIVLDNGALVLQFDKKGIAEFPKHKLSILENEMKCKPGRYTILTNIVAQNTDVTEPVAVLVDVIDEEDDEPIVVKKTTKKNKENK